MNNLQECALNKSLSVAGGDQTRSQSAHMTAAGLRARPQRPTAGSARRQLIGALAFAAVFGGIAGVGIVGVAGEASAKPMRDTTNNGVCTEINQAIRAEQRFATDMRREMMKAVDKQGKVDGQRLNTAQAGLTMAENNIKNLENQRRANSC